jgi:ABC-2 type transport system permease protein
MIILLHELRQNRKTLLIWTLVLGFICYGSILLYQSVENQLTGVADLYANMGDVTKALGMDKISIATLEGYYATEIGLMFGLGSGMFASMLGVTSLSKEEEGHTSEFLYTLPYKRSTILLWKYLSVVLQLLIFNSIISCWNGLGIWQLGGDVSFHSFFIYHLLVLLMQLELASICFLLSAISSKKQIGLAMGLVLILYSIDMIVRIISKVEFLKFITPYYYANGADVFSHTTFDTFFLVKACAVIIFSLLLSVLVLDRKDLGA